MFPELNNLLSITPDRTEQGKLTLLCDAKTDGSFLVHHFLSFYLKANCKVCFVALVQSFSHYNIVGQKLGNVVALVHDTEGAEDEENNILLNGLSHQSHLILRTQGLATGFCKDVHGQLSILWRRSSQPTAQRARSLTYQYKIQDKNVSFFAKGMSRAVL